INRKRWIAIGAEPRRVIVTGHTKVDQALEGAKKEEELISADLLSFLEASKVFLAASTHEGEEEALCGIFEKVQGQVQGFLMVLVPRHLERLNAVERLLKGRKFSYQKLSQINRTDGIFTSGIILVDQLGVLASLYSIADLAFIGGSLVPIGGHNIWEPLAKGVPILYGPYMDSDYGLAEQGGAIRASGPKELEENLILLFNSKERCEGFRHRMREFLGEHAGAVEKNIQLAEGLHPK
ncbi:MAG: hypothetical protein R3257_03985, partial [bacterium]|nr:hypothetical protein [bacterium]